MDFDFRRFKLLSPEIQKRNASENIYHLLFASCVRFAVVTCLSPKKGKTFNAWQSSDLLINVLSVAVRSI